jgi:lysophospholipid acyltransferase (LPLAT)-like uncharacterized protein
MKEGFQKKLIFFVAPRLIPLVIRLLGGSMRMKITDLEHSLADNSKQPFLIAFWHNRGIMMPYFYNKYFNAKIPGKVLISASQDGQLMTDIVKRFNIGAVRGSSSKNAVRALVEIARELRRVEMNLAIAPDGPRGPVYKVQPGIVYLAAHCGIPILPVSFHYSWQWRSNSWDRYPIPLPFTRCELVIGKPLRVEAKDDLQAAAEELERRLGSDKPTF